MRAWKTSSTTDGACVQVLRIHSVVMPSGASNAFRSTDDRAVRTFVFNSGGLTRTRRPLAQRGASVAGAWVEVSGTGGLGGSAKDSRAASSAAVTPRK